MSTNTSDDEIGDLCWNFFNSLGKCGKPNEKSEYTVLAAIVCENKSSDELNNTRVVALTTGTKCFPLQSLSNTDCITDCHAESLLKRAFKRHLISLYKNGSKVADDENRILTLFISQLPCGCRQRWKGDTHSDDIPLNDRKPGRGLLCRKPSCIKKIAKWNYMGLQGKQLMQLTKRPVYFDNIVIGNCGPIGEYDQQLLFDMISVNDDNCEAFKSFDLQRMPSIKFCQQFRNELFVRTESKRSSATAIVVWLEGNGQIVTEVVAEGRKHGLTKKNIATHQLLISDFCINKDIELIQSGKDNQISDNYQSQWDALKKSAIFKGWPVYSLPE